VAGSRSEAATQSKDLVSRLDLADVILDLINVMKEINAFEAAGKN
jgi:hypothetical protein